jgi:pSer/pThr/pTyr-binding forkhead associated (FHA) protein
MVQLKVLTGKQEGTAWTVRRFPVRIGRSSHADLRSEESGVWDQHLKLDFDPAVGLVLTTQPKALTTVNGESVNRAVLRNGDIIQLGSLMLQFWLSETRQRGLRFREGLTWATLAAISLGQVAIIYWLVR